jgi:ribulose-phosphate 3-epimerase
MMKDVHLMVREPLASLGEYVAAGADIVTIHPDACVHPHRVLQVLGAMTHRDHADRTIARGVALNPGTSVDVLDPFLDDIEMVMLVAINPGWGGQAFIEATLGRIDAVRQKIASSGREILVAVDGGITRRNIGQLAGRGVDIVVTGSAVFDGDLKANLDEMTRALRV